MAGSSFSELVRATASNSLISGIVGGSIGGFIGAQQFAIIADALIGAEGDTRLGLLVVIVPIFVGIGIVAWPDLSAGQFASAARRSLAPALLALAAGFVGLLAATPIYDSMATDFENPPPFAMAVAFAIVAGLVGGAIGVSQSTRKALLGVLGGLGGGFFGGALIAALGGGRNATVGQLLVSIPIAAALVGGAIGAAERVARQVWIEIADGPLGGREIILYGERIMLGSAETATVSLADPLLEPEHCELLVTDTRLEIRSLTRAALVRVNDRPVQVASVGSDDLIEIGASWLRIHRS